jgi:hypothetical protein
MRRARHYPLDTEKVLKAVNLSAPELRLLVSNYYQSHFSLITFEHNAQPQSDCEHLEFSVSRGPGKLQRLFWQMLLDHGRPMTFAEIRGKARVGYAREGRARRALQGLMNHGVVIATGSGGKGHPYHYSVNPLISVDINRNGNGS